MEGGDTVISLPAYVMDAVADIQGHLREAGLEDVRVEITAKHVFVQNRLYLKTYDYQEADE